MTTDHHNPSKPRRRWFQYSLRTLLVLVTVLCVWLGVTVNRARKQREAVAAIQELGGTVRGCLVPNGLAVRGRRRVQSGHAVVIGVWHEYVLAYSWDVAAAVATEARDGRFSFSKKMAFRCFASSRSLS